MGHEIESALPGFAEAVIGTETYESDNSGALAELRALLVARGHEIVISPRLPGVPLPLQALINACPKPPDETNAHEFLAEAKSLLAAKDAEPEAEEELLENDAEDRPKAEDAKKKLN